MARYIDADKIIQDFRNSVERNKPNELVKDIVNDIINLLQDEPTADVEEVVRCKDCQWATERTKDNELFQYQCRNTIACGKPRRAIDFCSYGARRDT